MPAPRKELEDLLAPHIGITTAGGSYRCICLHTYEPVQRVEADAAYKARTALGTMPDPAQRLVIDALHAQHIAEELIKAGVELPAPDPRQRLRDRVEQGKSGRSWPR